MRRAELSTRLALSITVCVGILVALRPSPASAQAASCPTLTQAQWYKSCDQKLRDPQCLRHVSGTQVTQLQGFLGSFYNSYPDDAITGFFGNTTKKFVKQFQCDQGIVCTGSETTTGGTAPYSYRVTSGTLPPGYLLSSAGVFSGSVTTAGSYTATIQATDSNGATGSVTYTWNIAGASPALTISPPSQTISPAPVIGGSVSGALSATGGTAPYSYQVISGTLPPGYLLSSAGVFSGSVTTAGSYSATIRATDANGSTGSVIYTWNIAGPTPPTYSQASYYSESAYTPISAAADIYVSPTGSDTAAGTLTAPYQTIARAQQRVREIKGTATGNITVYLRGGVYRLPQPLTFGPDDGGTASQSVTYQPYQGEKPVISGGMPITNWQGPSTTGVYTASVVGQNFRQLYADAYTPRPQRARYPQGGQYFAVTGQTLVPNSCAVATLTLEAPFDLTPSAVDALDGSEMVILKTFGQSRLTVSFAAITGPRQVTIHPDAASGQAEGCDAATNNLSVVGNRFRAYFENSPAFITAPGQWALRQSTLYYRPRPGDALVAGSIVAPRLTNLITIAGTPGNPVTNLSFPGIELAHTTWVSSSADDYITTQTGYLSFAKIGAVDIHGATKVSFTRSKLDDFGATGVVIGSGTDGVIVTQDDCENIAGNCVTIDTLGVTNAADPTQLANHLTIDDNVYQDVGLDYPGVAVFGGYVPNSSIGHNIMRYLSYSGISLGWFGLDQSLPPINTTVSGNDISAAMQLYHDGGGIYTPGGGDKGLTVTGNYIHDFTYVPNAGNFTGSLHAGIYLDGYASNVTATHNLERNLTDGLFVQTQNGTIDARAKHNTITDLGMVSVATPIYDQANVLAQAALPEVANTIQYDTNDRPDISAAAGISATTRALWATELAEPPPLSY